MSPNVRSPIEKREAITLENEGEKIFAILHRPLSAGPVPAIVICSGFGGNKCGKFRLFVRLGKELAKRGIAVLRFDYRGAGDSEGEFEEITLERKVSDTLLCLDFLAKDPQIDATRLGLLGRSLGGAIAVLAARCQGQVKSLVLWAPVFHGEPWRELWISYASHQSQEAASDILRHLPINISNLNFLQQFFNLDVESALAELKRVPLLHLHGMKDHLVKIEHAHHYEKARQGIEQTRFVQLPLSDHDFSNQKEQEIAIEETCQWFQHTL